MRSGDKSTKIAIRIDGDHCVHAHSVWAVCSQCVDTCPGGALSFEKGSKAPMVDAARCVSCGQCLSACSLGAFSSGDFSERRLLGRINSTGPMRIRCYLPYGELESLSLGWDSYHIGVCLAGLTAGALYQLAVGRPCELATGKCAECVLFPKVRETMKANFEAAAALLSDCGRRRNLRESTPLVLPAEEGGGASSEMPPDSAGSFERPDVLSRFTAIYRQVHKSAAGVRPALPLRARRKQVPHWRARLSHHWNEVPHVADGGSYRWPVHNVDADACRACGICMQLCPTGSITQGFGDGAFTYAFTPGYCAECGVCLTSCPAGAIERDHGTYAQPFDELLCFERAAQPCPRCGMPLFTQRRETVCRMCRRDSGEVRDDLR